MTTPETPFRKIEAVIKPFKLEEVKEALIEAGIENMTVEEVKGFGRNRGTSSLEIYRGAEYSVDFLPKYKITLYVNEKDAARLSQVIADAARTGKIGDGKVFTSFADRAIGIKKGNEIDPGALNNFVKSR